MKIKVAFLIVFALFLASCSTITPSPDFTVTYLSNNAWTVGVGVTYVPIDSIRVQNNTTVETMIYRTTYQYLKNGTIIYESPTDTFMSMNIVLPATQTVDGVVYDGKVTIAKIGFPFPTDVWDKMVENDWDGVTLRVFLHGRDNYGYNKTFTTSFDFGCIR